MTNKTDAGDNATCQISPWHVWDHKACGQIWHEQGRTGRFARRVSNNDLMAGLEIDRESVRKFQTGNKLGVRKAGLLFLLTAASCREWTRVWDKISHPFFRDIVFEMAGND